jgi:hypothetical protein
MKEEYLKNCVIDVLKRTVYLYSDEGSDRTIECETIDQFMNVLEVINSKLDPDQIEYADIPVHQPTYE